MDNNTNTSSDQQTCSCSRVKELKQRVSHIAILFGAVLLFVGFSFLVIRDVKPSVVEQGEPEGVHNGYRYVDLGLSVNWAEQNIGATEENPIGDRFAWAEIDTKDQFVEEGYTYIGAEMHSIERKRNHDAASHFYGRGWRMPTKDEVAELIEKCSWEPIAEEGRSGYNVIGPNGNSIFIPADTSATGDMAAIAIWSATADVEESAAYSLQVNDSKGAVVTAPAYMGLNVRAVTE